MSLPLVPVLVAGGGIAYVLAQSGAPNAPKPGAPQQLAPSGGSTVAVAMSQTGSYSPMVAYAPGNKTAILLSAFASSPMQVQSGWGYNANSVDAQLQAKLDQIEAAAKKAYEDANEVAKAAAADKLNKELKLDPPLTGHEDWATVSAVVGGAAGAAAGGALCGPVCAKLGALAGAYLGAKLADLVAKNWDELKDWLGDKWSDVKGYASDAVEEVGDFFQSIF